MFMEQHKLEKLVIDKLSIAEISKTLSLAPTTIRYWLAKFGLKTQGYVRTYNWDESKLREAIVTSGCKSDILRNLGISTKSGNFQTLEKYLKKYKIDTSHIVYDNKRGNKWNRQYTNEEIFIKDSSYGNGSSLKARIIKDELLDYRCDKCGNTGVWNDQKLVLHLDHMNGDHYDNRLQNLRFLCPNCHSQTETYCVGKVREEKEPIVSYCECGRKKDDQSNKCHTCYSHNQRKTNRPALEELEKQVNMLGYTGTGRMYGVADNTIRKWIKQYKNN